MSSAKRRELLRGIARAAELNDGDCGRDLNEARKGAWEGPTATVKRVYTATAVRSGRWWAIDVPDVSGVYSQARRLDQVEAMAREAIAVILDVPEDSFDVVVEPQIGTLGDLGRAIEDALRARQAAEVAQQASSTAMRHAVRELRSSGYSARDAGMLLGVSNQRICQIERSAGEKQPQTP